MSLLVINCGTSSIKMSLFKLTKRIADLQQDVHASDYASTISLMIDTLKERYDLSELEGIGHRVVHGGEHYTHSVRITPAVEKELKALSKLAPLHNPPALEGIACAGRLFPHVPQVAVFDTAFHATLPPVAAYYPIPWELSQKYHIKRYGFHGIAHAFSWKHYAEMTGRSDAKIITAHLGSGCSLAAINGGISVDTTMGFTPLDGLMMATRSGEVDPAIVSYLCEQEKKTPQEIIALLNHQSGILGVSELSADLRDILKNATHPQAQLALNMFVFHILKHVGALMAVLGGIDAIVFSGGIGENIPEIRRWLAQSLTWCGVSIDDQKNDACQSSKHGECHTISTYSSPIALYVVGSDENLCIAQEMISLFKTA